MGLGVLFEVWEFRAIPMFLPAAGEGDPRVVKRKLGTNVEMNE